MKHMTYYSVSAYITLPISVEGIHSRCTCRRYQWSNREW